MARIALRTVAAAAVFAAILGFSRFSFGLLLPAIKVQLPGSYAMYGFVAAANFAGYLIGTAAVPLLLRRWKNERVWNAVALVAMAAGMFATSLAATLTQVAALRFMVGVCSGVAAILTITLALSGVHARMRGLVSGGIWSGASIGLGICGALIDPHAGLDWRFQYAAMAVLSLFAILLFIAWPMERAHAASNVSTIPRVRWSGFLSRLLLAYALFGFGYIVYMVYTSAFLLRSGVSGSAVAQSWIVFAVGGTVGALAWGRIFDRFRSPFVLGAALAACACGVAFNAPFIAGMAIFGTPTIVSALARDIAGEAAYAKALSLLTAAFGVGQMAGPLGAGVAIDRAGLAAGVPIAAAPLLLAATLVCARHVRGVQ